MGTGKIIEEMREIGTGAWWVLVLIFLIGAFSSFWYGGMVASHSYDNRYPLEYSWWVDHEISHYPGVAITTAMVNTSCKMQGNIRPPIGDNVTQIQWIGGRDSGFVGNFKIVYNGDSIIVPSMDVGKCVYIYDAPTEIAVYGQDVTTGGWRQLGRRNATS